jgi:hypothetical protein
MSNLSAQSQITLPRGLTPIHAYRLALPKPDPGGREPHQTVWCRRTVSRELETLRAATRAFASAARERHFQCAGLVPVMNTRRARSDRGGTATRGPRRDRQRPDRVTARYQLCAGRSELLNADGLLTLGRPGGWCGGEDQADARRVVLGLGRCGRVEQVSIRDLQQVARGSG